MPPLARLPFPKQKEQVFLPVPEQDEQRRFSTLLFFAIAGLLVVRVDELFGSDVSFALFVLHVPVVFEDMDVWHFLDEFFDQVCNVIGLRDLLSLDDVGEDFDDEGVHLHAARVFVEQRQDLALEEFFVLGVDFELGCHCCPQFFYFLPLLPVVVPDVDEHSESDAALMGSVVIIAVVLDEANMGHVSHEFFEQLFERFSAWRWFSLRFPFRYPDSFDDFWIESAERHASVVLLQDFIDLDHEPSSVVFIENRVVFPIVRVWYDLRRVSWYLCSPLGAGRVVYPGARKVCCGGSCREQRGR